MKARDRARRPANPLRQVFAHAWIYLVGGAAAMTLIIVFFYLNPSTDMPYP